MTYIIVISLLVVFIRSLPQMKWMYHTLEWNHIRRKKIVWKPKKGQLPTEPKLVKESFHCVTA